MSKVEKRWRFDFTSFKTVFQLYQDVVVYEMLSAVKPCLRLEDLGHKAVSNLEPLDQQASALIELRACLLEQFQKK